MEIPYIKYPGGSAKESQIKENLIWNVSWVWLIIQCA